MNIPFHPTSLHSSLHGPQPSIWCGTVDRDGDAAPWKDEACGSIYLFLDAGTAAVHYVKIANAPEDADWASTVD